MVEQTLEGTIAIVTGAGSPIGMGRWMTQARDRREAMIQPDVMREPVVWLASSESDGITGQRFIAYHWDSSLPWREAIEKAGAPIAWPQLGGQTIWQR
jgi:hypothetical protein